MDKYCVFQAKRCRFFKDMKIGQVLYLANLYAIDRRCGPVLQCGKILVTKKDNCSFSFRHLHEGYKKLSEKKLVISTHIRCVLDDPGSTKNIGFVDKDKSLLSKVLYE